MNGRSPLLPEPAEIVEKHSFGPTIHRYHLRLLDPGARPRFDFVPGQFNMVYVPGVGEVAISISSDPAEVTLEHTIRIVGRTMMIEQACSGIQSLYVVLASLLFALLWYRVPVFRSLALIAAAIVWVLAGNIARIVLATFAEARYGIDLLDGVGDGRAFL